MLATYRMILNAVRIDVAVMARRRHFRDRPVNGHPAGMPKSTRTTQSGTGAYRIFHYDKVDVGSRNLKIEVLSSGRTFIPNRRSLPVQFRGLPQAHSPLGDRWIACRELAA
jgi:hypothetical protein